MSRFRNAQVGMVADFLADASTEELNAIRWSVELEVRSRENGAKKGPPAATASASAAPVAAPPVPALTARQAADRLGISLSVFYRRARAAGSNYDFILGGGREVRVCPARLAAWIARHSGQRLHRGAVI